MSTTSEITACKGDLLSAGELDALRKISSPTIANAIETFDVRPRGSGVTGPGVVCVYPSMGAMVGYARTATIITGQPATAKSDVSRVAYWRHIQAAEGPTVIVMQDLSQRPGGAYFGEVNASMHKALGAIGVLTSGTVRDIPEVERVGFHFFCSGAQVSHGFAHLEDFGYPVEVFGMRVCPGDLIHADSHGAVVIPREIAPLVAAVGREIERKEQAMLAACRLEDPIPTLDELISHEY